MAASHPDRVERLGVELAKAEYEPLLPIENKLVGWSLGTGVVLLALLAILTRVV